MLTHPLPSVVTEPLPSSQDDRPPASSPPDAGGTITQEEIDPDADVERQLAALGAANLRGMMMAQAVMRHVLKPKHMHDAWAAFMHSYRHVFHTQGYAAANAFARREAVRLLQSRKPRS